MRHTGMYVVELGVGIGKGGESCRRKKGKRIVEESLIMNNKPGKKACLSGEGVAVDKIRKCGRYIAYTALVALH